MCECVWLITVVVCVLRLGEDCAMCQKGGGRGLFCSDIICIIEFVFIQYVYRVIVNLIAFDIALMFLLHVVFKLMRFL